MAALMDFALYRREDATLGVAMQPPTLISGWNIQCTIENAFGGISGTFKSCASGFNNVSGINVIQGSTGVFNVQINSIDTSGWDQKPYAFAIERLDQGARTTLVEGFLLLLPGGG